MPLSRRHKPCCCVEFYRTVRVIAVLIVITVPAQGYVLLGHGIHP